MGISGTGDHMTEAPMRPRRQMLTADRAKLCTKLTALCLALLAAPLYGQSGLAATSPGTVSYGSPTFAVQNASDLQMQSPYLGGGSRRQSQCDGVVALPGGCRRSWPSAKSW